MKWFRLYPSIEAAREALGDFPEQVQAGTTVISVYMHRDRLFAIADRCPHAGASLSEGHVNEFGEVVCPLHHYCYDLKTGEEASSRTDAVRTYPIEIRSDGVYIGVS